MDVVERQQLSDIAELDRLLGGGRFDYWLFGGWGVDFHVGTVTRPHGDIDLAVWRREADAVGELLAAQGWHHAPAADEDGGTGYERNGVRVELTFLVEGDRGEVLIAFRHGTALWWQHAFGMDVRELGDARARVVPLDVMKQGKLIPRQDPKEAAIDRADFHVLSQLRADPLG